MYWEYRNAWTDGVLQGWRVAGLTVAFPSLHHASVNAKETLLSIALMFF
jgi:hypothetical protein